jgi:hypothetical protein
LLNGSWFDECRDKIDNLMMDFSGSILSVNPFEVEVSNLRDSFEFFDNLIPKLDFLDKVVVFSGFYLLMKKLVFLSPAFSQRLQDCFFQYSSSSLHAVQSCL